MPNNLSDVSKPYARGDLTEAIRCGLTSQGKSTGTVMIEDLAPIDAFHIGGRRASEEFHDQLAFAAQTKVLDLGCGRVGLALVTKPKRG